MPSDLQTSAGARAAAGDLAKPHIIDAAVIALWCECRGRGPEQQLDAQSIVSEAVVDDVAERRLGGSALTQLHVRQIEPVPGARLIACGSGARGLVKVQRL